MARFTQAISEGDGISLVPFLAGNLESLARAADESGAEALAVESAEDVERVRAVTGLPVLLRRRARTQADLDAAETVGADAVVLGAADFDEDGGELEKLYTATLALELDCAIEVGDDEELAHVLESIDPDIVAIADEPDDVEEAFEHTLDVLPDVPAGKLVIAQSRRMVREQVLALERAGVDAILIADVALGGDFASALADLVGGE